MKSERLFSGKGIALWDVLASCEREGSLDAAIREPVPNQVEELLSRYPGIHTIFLNGQKAGAFYRRLIEPKLARRVESIVLPSSSPARAMPFEKKLRRGGSSGNGWKRRRSNERVRPKSASLRLR